MRTIASMVLVASTVFGGSAVAQQQLIGTGQFCIKGASGPVKCEYHTMAQCDEARPKGSPEQCLSRPQAEGTVAGPTLREQPAVRGEQKD